MNHFISIFYRKNKDAKVTNFYKVEETMRNLNIKFDAKLIHNVMNEEPGASIRLLHIIMRGIDKIFSQSNQTVTGLKQSTVDSRVK